MDKKEIIENFDLLEFDDNELIEKKNKIAINLNKLNEEINVLIDENSNSTKNQKEWNALHDKKVNEYKIMEENYLKIVSKLEDNESRRLKIEKVKKALSQNSIVTEFDEDLFQVFVDKVIVKDGDLEFIWKV